MLTTDLNIKCQAALRLWNQKCFGIHCYLSEASYFYCECLRHLIGKFVLNEQMMCMCTRPYIHTLNVRWNSNAQQEKGLPVSLWEQPTDMHSELGSIQASWPISQYRWWPNNLLREIANAFRHTLVSRKPPEHHIFIGWIIKKNFQHHKRLLD